MGVKDAEGGVQKGRSPAEKKEKKGWLKNDSEISRQGRVCDEKKKPEERAEDKLTVKSLIFNKL